MITPMQFSHNWLQSFFKKKLPRPDKLAELLTMHAFEVKEVKKIGKDFVLDIDVLPNRAPDCFSYFGMAREIRTITNLTFFTGAKKIKLNEDKELKTKDFVKIEVKNKEDCPRYTARVLSGVKVGPSPKWIQERLEISGLRAINNIVDIVNYLMLETGQPLHAFDGQKLKEGKILVRRAKRGEEIVTLDEEKYDLDKEILVIADTKKPIAIAGIKGGKEPEIDMKTKIVVLESANFNPQVVRRGSRKLNLKTDASLRFEHGLDQNLTEFAINQASYLIQKITGGKICQGLIDIYPQKVLPKKIKLNLDYLEGLSGVKITLNEIKNILKRLNFKIIQSLNRSTTQSLIIEVPTFRLDISLPEDLIEEIGRIYGYQKIPSIFPVAALIPPKKNLDIFWESMTKDILKEVGFSEVYNYSFIGQKEREVFQYQEKEIIEVENPTSLEFQYLRPGLIPNLLKNIQRNQKNFEEIKIFELGKTFKNIKYQISKISPDQIFSKKNLGGQANQNSKIIEKRMLAGLINREAFYKIKGVVNSLLNKLGISNVWYVEYQPSPEDLKTSFWQLKRCAEIKINNEEIGFLGEISSRILNNLKIENKVTAFDIDFEKLSKLASEEHEYQPISRFPAAVRDLAILVPRRVKIEEVLNKIKNTGGSLIRDINLFDIYEGEEIPEGKKNLAFHLIYQAKDRTLSSEEIDRIQNKIIQTLEKELDWELRK